MKLLLGWLSGSSSKREALSAKHEGAETRFVLNAKDAIQNKYKRVIVMDGVRNDKAEKNVIWCTLFYRN